MTGSELHLETALLAPVVCAWPGWGDQGGYGSPSSSCSVCMAWVGEAMAASSRTGWRVHRLAGRLDVGERRRQLSGMGFGHLMLGHFPPA